MCAADQLQPAASADLRPTFASGLYFQTKPSTCCLIPIAQPQCHHGDHDHNDEMEAGLGFFVPGQSRNHGLSLLRVVHVRFNFFESSRSIRLALYYHNNVGNA